MRRSIYLTYRSGYLIPGIHPSQELIPTKIFVLGVFPSWMPIVRGRVRNFDLNAAQKRQGYLAERCPDCGSRERAADFCHGVCETCSEDYYDCERCDERTHESYLYRVRSGSGASGLPATERWCRGCFDRHADTCEGCGDYVSDGISTEDVNRDRWCPRCSENHLSYCDDCDAWYPEGSCPLCVDDVYRNESDRVIRGVRTARFTLRPVGLEIETGHGGKDRDFLRALPQGWGVHEDSSLQEDAVELVSPPISGDKIETHLRQVYSQAASYDVSLQDSKAGFHVHVSAKGVYGAVQSAESPKIDDRRQDRALQWGKAAVNICRQFISKARRENSYCAAGFAVRSYSNYHPAMKKCEAHSYPTIAVRDNTIEFRLWPSTKNMEYHLARIELSQKLVGLLDRSVRGNRGIAPDLKRLWHLASFFETPLKPLAKLLGLSSETLETLMILQAKYRIVNKTTSGAA